MSVYVVTSSDFLLSYVSWLIQFPLLSEQIKSCLISVVLLSGGSQRGNIHPPQANGGSKLSDKKKKINNTKVQVRGDNKNENPSL